jgi:hypothetical protein
VSPQFIALLAPATMAVAYQERDFLRSWTQNAVFLARKVGPYATCLGRQGKGCPCNPAARRRAGESRLGLAKTAAPGSGRIGLEGIRARTTYPVRLEEASELI